MLTSGKDGCVPAAMVRMQMGVDDSAEALGAQRSSQQRECLIGVSPVSRIDQDRPVTVVATKKLLKIHRPIGCFDAKNPV